MERLLRKPEARRCFAVGKTTFEERIVPRLDKVFVGPRTVTFTQTSVERLIEELKAESAAVAAAAPPVPVAKRKASVNDIGNGERHEHHDGEQRQRHKPR